MDDFSTHNQPEISGAPAQVTFDAELSNFSTDDIYKAIARRHLGFDFDGDRLSEPLRATVYRDVISMEFVNRINRTPVMREARRDFDLTPGATVLYEGTRLTVSILGTENLVLHNETDGSDVEVSIASLGRLFRKDKNPLQVISTNTAIQDDDASAVPSPDELTVVLERAEMLELAKTSPKHVLVSKRTLQRWRRAMSAAGEAPRVQHFALVPRTRYRGNRNIKVPSEVIGLIEKVAKEHFNTPTAITKTAAFRLFCAACDQNNVVRCSQRTFNIRIAAFINLVARVGRRLADKTTPIPFYIEFAEPVHGVRAWEYVHFDHTEVDLELKTPDETALRKAWLSLAICVATRKVVGFYLSFSAPSYFSCMMLLRDIVLRHGRLPEMIVVDNGPDFRSHAFKRVCRLYKVGLRYRPKGKPRYGAVMERIFGTTNTEFIHNLKGNTKLMKYARSVTRAVNPDNFVEWTLVALHGGIEYFFDNLYGNEPHPAYNEKPNHRFERLIHEAGARVHKWVRYDKQFRIETCPPPEAGPTRIIDQVRGIKVQNAFFVCDAIRDARLHSKKVQIRIEPWDPSIVYALVEKTWHTCRSRAVASYGHLTAIELRYALQEVAKRSGSTTRSMSPERVREWLQILKAENFDSRLRLCQQEMRLIYGPLNMCVADDQATPPRAKSAPSISPAGPVSPKSAVGVPIHAEHPDTDSILTEEAFENDEYEILG